MNEQEEGMVSWKYEWANQFTDVVFARIPGDRSHWYQKFLITNEECIWEKKKYNCRERYCNLYFNLYWKFEVKLAY